METKLPHPLRSQKKQRDHWAELSARLDDMEPQISALEKAARDKAPMTLRPTPYERPTCTKCGRAGHASEVCGIKCHNCGKLGHKAFKCRAPKSNSNQGRENTRNNFNCTYCKRSGHTADRCFRNPESSSYKGANKDKVEKMDQTKN
jgi:hypothetical protein